jgi:YidC/Oxa1 family membrane protein insertase
MGYHSRLGVWLAILGLCVAASGALAQKPTDGQGPFAKAAALADKGQLKDALAEYAQIIKDHAGTDLTITTQARFAKAEILKKLRSQQEALKEYAEIVKENRGKDAESAAKALYQGGLYASSPDFPGTITQKKQALDTAYQLWRQLRDEYPTTEAARKIAGPSGPMQALMDRIDRRNSSDWKYQIIDFLVRLTGKNPAYSYAAALILLAVLVKFLMLPLSIKQYASMREMQRMQPLVKELGKKYKGAELNQKTMELYKEHKVNPFAGCFTGLLQVPFLILIFNAIREYEIAFAHGKFLWIGSPLSQSNLEILGQPMLGRNLASPDVPLLAIYVITNYVTMRMTPASDPQQQQQQNTMALFTSLLFFWMFLSYKWSSAFVLYWLALNGLSIWQQYEMIYKPTKLAAANGGAVPVAPIPAKPEPQIANPTLSPTTTPQRVRPRKKKR